MHITLGVELGNREFAGLYPLTSSPRADSYLGFWFSAKSDRAIQANQINVIFTNDVNGDATITFA